MSFSSVPSIGSSAASILNSAFAKSKDTASHTISHTSSPVSSLEGDHQTGESSIKSATIEKSEPADRSHEKLVNAAKAYLETVQLVNILRGGKAQVVSNPENESEAVSGGAGRDLITVHRRAEINAGGGDDIITAFSGGQLNAGEGNDFITAHSNAQINAGSGDDTITSYGSFSQVNAGLGDDRITSFGFSQVNAGGGNDLITAFGDGPVNGEDGNDTIISYGAFAQIDAGAGSDVITAGALSNITGGSGDDIITAIGSGVTINYNKGDGSDEVHSANDIVVAIGDGLSSEDLNITYEGGKAIVSFNDGGDKLSLKLSSSASAELVFADGRSVKV